MLRAAIAEDDVFFRQELVQLIESIGGVQIQCCTESGEELLNSLNGMSLELVFLDIGLPGLSGIDTAKAVRASHPATDIIFITSHDQYLRDAVDLYAADYITKPVNVARLEQTIARLKGKHSLQNLLQLRTGESIELLKENDIFMAEALVDKTRVYALDKEFDANCSLKELESMVNNNLFFRASRSYLVNIQKVSSIRPSSRTSFELNFNGKSFQALLSKKLYQDFRRRVKRFANTERWGEQ